MKSLHQSLENLIDEAKKINIIQATKEQLFIQTVAQFGTYDKDIFGSVANPTSINLADVKEVKPCPHCQQPVDICDKDVPHILSIAGELSNGVAGGFRNLSKSRSSSNKASICDENNNPGGIDYIKAQDFVGFIFSGPKVTEQGRPSIPSKIYHHFDKLVNSKQEYCSQLECNTLLIGEKRRKKNVPYIPRNWVVCHKDASDYSIYDNQKIRDIDTYELMCTQCNGNETDREIDKQNRRDYVDNSAIKGIIEVL